ncbi:MAG TPA: peptidylprolyl isomerase [Thermoanaerobaculia bacterium]|nr:peptidylprolyl isomerase [Thermoanaerobaculia bacterium]
MSTRASIGSRASPRLPAWCGAALPWTRIVLAIAVLAAGCLPVGSRPGSPADLPVVDLPDLEERALLLLMVDRQRAEPVVVSRAMTGTPSLREAAAVTLGRVGQPAGASYLQELLVDEEAPVRRAAAFALGELDFPPLGEAGEAGAERQAAARALTLAAADADREVGRLAVEALGKLGVALAAVTPALGELPEPERWARLLPSLFRFDEPGVVPVGEAALAAVEDPGLHRHAAYALARVPRPEAVPTLRRLLGDGDPRVRAWASRALGLAGDGGDLRLLSSLLADADGGVIVQALRAGALRAAADPPAADAAAELWSPGVERLLGDPRPQVRLAVLEAAAPWVAAVGLATRLEAIVTGGGDVSGTAPAGGSPAERAAALVALAQSVGAGGAERTRVLELVALAAGSPHRLLRRAAATALGSVAPAPGEAVGERLLGDPDPAVRAAAVAALLPTGDGPPPSAVELAERVLAGDDDPGVQATVLGWLAEHPVLPYAELTRATGAALAAGEEDAALAGVAALAARGRALAAERGGAVAVLEQLAGHRRWLVRRRAAAALAELGRPVPDVRGPEPRPLPVYRSIVQRTARPRTVEIVTDAGSLRLLLDCPTAPLTCHNFLQLAEQGFYDGIAFHRVVPDFVVQDGDPRGDGSGGPGWAIRDEINRIRYDRGVLGMALSGPDTGGSQWFLTLAPQPHLDGGYTAFGQVVAGDETLDRILPGTVIERVREVR